MKELSKSSKVKSFIVTKMTDHITFLDNNVKLAVYIGRIFMDSINYWIPNYIDHFKSALSEFWSFVFH